MRMSEPSSRNFEIFQEVEYSGLSLRKAAQKYELSVGRIQQIVAQVRAWKQAMAANYFEGSPGFQATHGYVLCEGRLRYLYGQALKAWRASKTDVTKSRSSSNSLSGTILTTARSFGDPRYLAMAMRLTEAQLAATFRHVKFRAKLPVEAPTEMELVEDVAEELPAPYAHEEEVREVPAVEEIMPVAATAEEEPVCDAIVDAMQARRSETTEELTPMRPRMLKKQARHEKRKAARERQRERRHALAER